MTSKFFLPVLCLFTAAWATAQDLSVTAIPDSLKANAYSVLRFQEETVEISDIKSGKRTDSYAVTVLNEKGEGDATFRFYGDTFRELKSFSAKLYDANGNLLKKYGKSDLMFSEYSSNLASDNKITYFECSAPSIPFTIRYDFEVSYRNGILGYGTFMPIGTFNQSVQRCQFRLLLPEGIKPRIKSLNGTPKETVATVKGITNRTWLMENLKAIESEPLHPPLEKLTPLMKVVPSDIQYDGVPGFISTWSDMGKWTYSLTEGRDVLPDLVKAKILERVQSAKSEREKVKILYDFLGETTRYVSIQLGIGGYQPMPASEVNKTGFGDCKALTNYMKAMLAVVGIPSEYCTIRFDDEEKDLMPDFPSFSELNHVILKVPLKEETLWLECTNPTFPFGYIHEGIAGHQVLVCKKEGSVMERLPDYADSLNVEFHSALVSLLDDGSATVRMNKKCKAKIYESYAWFPNAKSSIQVEKLREDIHLPNVTLGKMSFREEKSAMPSIDIDCIWTTSLYGSKTGSRIFLPVNIFRTGFDHLRRNKRTQDVCIYKGFRDLDSIDIKIPATFEVENLPASVVESSPYGRFSSNVSLQGDRLRIVQLVDIPSGRYDAAKFADFMTFMNKITAAYKGKVILRKKTA